MNEIIRLKYLDIRDGIKVGRIVDEGCADGALLAEISRDFPDSDLFGIDLSAEFAGRFHERQRAGEFGGAYVHFFHRNLLDRIFEPESIDTTICNSTLHELWSYGEGEKSVRSYLAEKFRQLRPGGRLIIRDVVGPEDGDVKFSLVFGHRRRKSSARQLAEHAAAKPTGCANFPRAAGSFCSRRTFSAGAALSRLPKQSRGRPVFRLALRQAAEFLSKKDYTDNWKSEMNEEFCFWSFTQWKQALSETGFRIFENADQPERGSRFYANPWIVENRYSGCVNLLGVDGVPLDWPPSNMVIVAEKPLT